MSDPQRPGVDDPALGKTLNSWLAAGVLAGVVLVAAFPVYRLVEGDRREGALERQRSAQVAVGHEIWGAACADCHGDQGEGAIGSPALNAAEFFEAATQQQVHHVIQSGVPGTDMLAWWNEFGGALTDEQIRSLVAYIYEWEEDAPNRPDWRDPGSEDPMDGGVHEDPPEIDEEVIIVEITVGDDDCGPLQIEVAAGAPFVIEFQNQGSGTRSLEFQGVDDHIHAKPGETTTVEVAALDPREYRFECLGTGHATVLGSGVIRAMEEMHGGVHEDPPGVDGAGLIVEITVGDVDCGPLQIEVAAGAPFVIEFQNQGSGTRSLEFQGVDDHIHAKPGETTTVEVAALDPGEYRFECLGTGHATVLGSGVIRVP